MATLCGMCDLCSPTRDRTRTLNWKRESYPLDCQGSPIYCIYWLSVWYTKYTVLWYLTVCFLWMKKMDSLRMNSHERVRSYTSSEPHFPWEPQVRLELANSSSKYIRLWSINCFPCYQTKKVYICKINWHLKNPEQGREEPFLKFIYLFIFTVERHFFFPLVAFINSAILNLLVYTVCLHKQSHTHVYLSAYFL